MNRGAAIVELQSVTGATIDSGAAAVPTIKVKEGQALRENMLELFCVGPHCGISLALKM